MSDQDGRQAADVPLPSLADTEGWKAYWQAKGQRWRTRPLINIDRQDYLDNRRRTPPNIEQGIYPFKDVEPKLTRADIEWLLATHESGGICGPVDLSDERQREREGLDLRGAHLEGEDLSGLPLARIHGGLTFNEWFGSTKEQRKMAAVHLQKVDLWLANLQEAYLEQANLQEAYLEQADLQEADLTRAQLKGADLEEVTLRNEKQVGPQLADSQWDNVNLAVIKWSQVKILGDEYHTKQKKRSDGDIKKKQERLPEYEAAVRANRQLAVVLRNQGLNEVADRFAYRAHVLQWHVLYWQLPEQLEEIQSHSQQQGTGQQNANEGAQFNLPGDCTIVCVNGQSGKT